MARFCSNCGASVEPDQKFCMSCGAPVIEVTQQSANQAGAAGGAGVGTAAAAGAGAAAADGAGAGAAGAGAGATQGTSTSQTSSTSSSWSQTNSANSGAGAAYSTPQPQAQVITNGSELSRAWNDFKSEKGQIGRVIILTLLGCVPILNFVVLGYCLIWGANAALGGKQGMPSKYVSSATFTLGFFAFVVSLVWVVVYGVLSAIPLIGLLATLAFLVLLPCLFLCNMRLSLFGSLSSAFEISKVWDLFKPNMGTALVITWVPSAIAIAVALVASAFLGLFGGTGVLVGLTSSSGLIASAGMVTGAILLLILTLLSSLIEVAVSLVIYRAFGYFIADNAPQWVRDGLIANPQARV